MAIQDVNFKKQRNSGSAARAVHALISILVSAAALLGCGQSVGGLDADKTTAWIALHPDEYRDAVLQEQKRADPLLCLYRDSSSRNDAIAFFSAIVNSDTIAQVILEQADEYDLPPALMTAVAWEESRFDPRATNRNVGSVDRGLFQLNSKSFPELTEKDFFNAATNTRYAAAHLRWCLDLAGSEVAALAMYNAGTARVQSDKTPKKTLDYASRVLDFEDGIESLVDSELLRRWDVSYDGLVQAQIPDGRFSRTVFFDLPILRTAR